MKIKIRPFGWINILHLFITIILICLCIAWPLYNTITSTYNVFSYVALLFVFPLVVHFAQFYNRFIMVDQDKIIFHIDCENPSLFKFPKFYNDEFPLKDLKYYGVFSAPYIKGYKKADKTDKKSKPNTFIYHTLEVKEGKLKIPLGSIIVGNPLAFVFSKNQYILDDYLFTNEQYSALFRAIEDNCDLAPSGAVKSGYFNEEDNSGLASSFMIIFSIVCAIALPIGITYLLSTFTALPIVFAFRNNLTTSFVTVFILGSLSLVIRLHSDRVKSQSFEKYEVIGFIANVCTGLFYTIALVIFIVGYIL